MTTINIAKYSKFSDQVEKAITRVHMLTLFRLSKHERNKQLAALNLRIGQVENERLIAQQQYGNGQYREFLPHDYLERYACEVRRLKRAKSWLRRVR